MTGVRAPLLLVAASGLAREAASAARAAGEVVLGCLDDDVALVGTEVAAGLRVLGTIGDVGAHSGARLVVCAGKGSTRSAIVERLAGLGVDGGRYGTIVDPGVRVGVGSSVGAGSILLAGSVLTADVTVGEHVVCMPQVVLTHDCRIGSYATLCAGVVLGGGVVVGSRAYVGMVASVRENLSLGEGSVVGMGAVVLRDVPPSETWAGIPARRLAP